VGHLLQSLQYSRREGQRWCLACMEWASRANRRGAEKRGEEDQRVEVLSSLIRVLVEVGTVRFLRTARHTVQ
jgi:hypothetical protein